MLVIVNKQLTGLILLCKVFETSSQNSKCLLVLPYQWLVRHRQKKIHLSLVFAYCTLTCISHFPIYTRVEINRAGVFGPKIFPFGTLTCNSQFPIYMRVEINQAGVFGPKIFPFRTLTCNSDFPIYMRVEINRAGVFGPKIFLFRTLTCNSDFPIYMRMEINWAGVFGPKIFPFRTPTWNSHFPVHMHTQRFLECIQLQLSWLPCSTPRLSSKILNLQNNHFGHLTSGNDLIWRNFSWNWFHHCWHNIWVILLKNAAIIRFSVKSLFKRILGQKCQVSKL